MPVLAMLCPFCPEVTATMQLTPYHEGHPADIKMLAGNHVSHVLVQHGRALADAGAFDPGLTAEVRLAIYKRLAAQSNQAWHEAGGTNDHG